MLTKGNKVYRITFWNNLKSGYLIIILIPSFIIFNIYASKYYSYYNFKSFLLTIVGFFPFLGPAIFVHVEYIIRNWKTILKIDKANKILKYKNRKKEIGAKFEDVAKIVKYQAKKTALLGDAYDYYEIFLKNGESFIITSLMAPNLKIPGIEIKVIDCYFPSVYFQNKSFEGRGKG